uniref:Uncharacterized protein n=1 Tax=Anguilla anguilla TaxID=7936 RepID=A0A0E9SNT0_ANGAN
MSDDLIHSIFLQNTLCSVTNQPFSVSDKY